MASQRLYQRLVELTALLTLLTLTGEITLSLFFCLPLSLWWVTVAPSKSGVAVAPAKAKEFLAKLRRPERNIWDRRRPDVQQWIMPFTYMGFDETVIQRSNDQGRQHHYDENEPNEPHSPPLLTPINLPLLLY
uniref:Uncharacterized protein n=1 Tax=Oncorhynchus tshawytscha TaxID=74940 RepID=A0A8C8JW55_ONCTS